MKSILIGLCLTTFCVQSLSSAEPKKPKYGPGVTLLATDHKFIRDNPAFDYWKLTPFYIGQQTESACSLAIATMVVNAARSSIQLSADQELVIQSELLKKLGDSEYEKKVAMGGEGINLEKMKDVLERSFQSYGLKNFSITLIRTPADSRSTQERLHQALIENEKSGSDLIVANFIQGVLTGDESVGHFAPIGAYDSKRKRVLVLDPDRQWYEPYWVSEAALLKAMIAPDKAAPQGRGYLWIKFKD